MWDEYCDTDYTEIHVLTIYSLLFLSHKFKGLDGFLNIIVFSASHSILKDK